MASGCYVERFHLYVSCRTEGILSHVVYFYAFCCVLTGSSLWRGVLASKLFFIASVTRPDFMNS